MTLRTRNDEAMAQVARTGSDRFMAIILADGVAYRW
jgi:hypothetical protein